MELIIAVAILAIAISPLIANFIQSSKMNLQGRQDLDAMNLAQDIMEGLSGYTADEVSECIDKVIVNDSGTESLVGNILPASSEYDSVAKTSADGDAIDTYMVYNVEAIGSVKNVYNAEIILDPTGEDQKDFNNQEVANISEINQYYDAIFTIPTDTDLVEAISKLSEKATGGRPLEDYYGKLERTTEVNIQNVGTEAAPNYKVSVSRTYGPAEGEYGILGLGSTDTHTIVTDNISRMDSNKFPRSVYIYFTGIQGASYYDSRDMENISVTNTTGEEITVYLIRTQKQDSSTGKISQEDINYGNTFGCRVGITSKDMSGALTQDVYIVSNLRYNLNAISPRYNFRVTDEDGNAIENLKLPLDDAGNKILASQSTYVNARAKYFYNTEQVNEALYQTHFSDGYNRKDKNTIYKVVINLYDSSTGEKVATYDGGLSN